MWDGGDRAMPAPSFTSVLRGTGWPGSRAPSARAVALLLLLLSLSQQLHGAGQTRLVPVDQAASVPDFFSFRARLQGAVARHDMDAVVSVLSADIALSFGGDAGHDAFIRMWKQIGRAHV